VDESLPSLQIFDNNRLHETFSDLGNVLTHYNVVKASLYWSVLDNLALVITLYAYSMIVIREFRRDKPAKRTPFGCKIVAVILNPILIVLLIVYLLAQKGFGR